MWKLIHKTPKSGSFSEVCAEARQSTRFNIRMIKLKKWCVTVKHVADKCLCCFISNFISNDEKPAVLKMIRIIMWWAYYMWCFGTVCLRSKQNISRAFRVWAFHLKRLWLYTSLIQIFMTCPAYASNQSVTAISSARPHPALSSQTSDTSNCITLWYISTINICCLLFDGQDRETSCAQNKQLYGRSMWGRRCAHTHTAIEGQKDVLLHLLYLATN